LSFRQAHEIAAATASAVIAQGESLQNGYQAFTQAFEQMLGRKSVLDELVFKQVTSLKHFVDVRECFGGPGATAMNEAAARYTDTLSQLYDAIAAAPERIAKADSRRQAAFSVLLQGSAD